MRRPEFPFAKYREWESVPQTSPELDSEGMMRLAEWLDRRYKRPILDDITDSYQFHPSLKGIKAYTTRAAARLFAGKSTVSEAVSAQELIGRKNRMPVHIAESAELATALFWTAAEMRREAVSQTLEVISKAGPMNTDISDTLAARATDAIADFGYCLMHPADKDHQGRDHGDGLHTQLERVAPGVGLSLQQFGLYAGSEPSALFSFDGVVALQVTLEEQERRINHWRPRHAAVLEAYPDISVSEEVLLQRLPYQEITDLYYNKDRQ